MLRLVHLMICLSLLLSGCAHFSDPEQKQKQNKRQLQGHRQQQAQWQHQEDLLQQQLEQNKQLSAHITKIENAMESQSKSINKLSGQIKKMDSSVTSANSQIQTIINKNQSPRPPSRSISGCKQSNKIIMGEKEWIYLPAAYTHLKARVDSGATTSSISATNIERFERDGQKWVRFDLNYAENNLSVSLERPLERRVAIKQSSTDGKESRLVISLMIKVGGLSQNTQFTLADRSNMGYPVLLGRSFLRDIVLIDVSKQFFQTKYVPDFTEQVPSEQKTNKKHTEITP